MMKKKKRMHTKQRGGNWGRSRCREHLRSPRSIVSWRSSGTWHYRITFCRRIPHQISAITRRRKREQRGERKELTLEIRTGKEQWHYLLKYHKEITQMHDNSSSRKGVKEKHRGSRPPTKDAKQKLQHLHLLQRNYAGILQRAAQITPRRMIKHLLQIY